MRYLLDWHEEKLVTYWWGNFLLAFLWWGFAAICYVEWVGGWEPKRFPVWLTIGLGMFGGLLFAYAGTEQLLKILNAQESEE